MKTENSFGGVTSKRFLGAFFADWLVRHGRNLPDTEVRGKWVLARPVPYYSFWVRLQQAWDVLKYRADALYWEHQFPDVK